MGFSMRLEFTDIIQPGTLKQVIRNGQLFGYAFQVRLAYYRGHYLSCIDQVELAVDGQVVPPAQWLFCLDGREYEPGELQAQSEVFWEIIQPATILVKRPGGLPAGNHTIRWTLFLRSPYMPQPGTTELHRYVPIDASDEVTMTLQEGV